MSKNIEDVLSPIRSRDFGALIGFEEGLFFDAKQKTPYNLDSPNGRYELAKMFLPLQIVRVELL